MTPRRADTIRTLRSFDPGPGPDARRSLEQTLNLVQSNPRAFDRHCYDPGHVTASGIVLAPRGQEVLLVYHHKLHRWLQPGGHVEPDDRTLAATAAREILEETGVTVPQRALIVVAVDVHRIPAGAEPAHQHFDVMFAATAARRCTAPPPDTAAWHPIDTARSRCQNDAAVARGLERALAALAGTESRPAGSTPVPS